MRYIIVPPDVQLRDSVTGEPAYRSEKDLTPDDPWTLHRVIQRYALVDGAWPKGAKGASAARRVRRKVEGAQAGDVVALESSDWEALKKVLEEPQAQWLAVLSEQLVEFFDAVLEAKDFPPST